jgi:hypothetical protein
VTSTSTVVDTAITLAEKGKRVVIVVQDHNKKLNVQEMIPVTHLAYIFVRCLDAVGKTFNWETLTDPAWPDYEFLMDHYVIEQRCGKLLEVLQRSD